MRTFLAPVLLASLVACSSSNPGGGGAGAGGLDCGWLAGDNCYKQTVAASTNCLPAMGERGMLSQDNKTCTYASGQVVTFDMPLTLPLPMDPVWKFTVTSQGQTCLRVDGSPSSTFIVTSSAGTFTETTSGLALSMTCPDGKSFSNGNAFDLFSCDGGFSAFPGSAWSGSDTSVSFSLLGATGGQQPVFFCSKM
jgi:hypothetical protein